MLMPRGLRGRRYNPDGWNEPMIFVILSGMLAFNLAVAVWAVPDLPRWPLFTGGLLIGFGLTHALHLWFWKLTKTDPRLG
jgi:hypothetical protein